VTDGKSFQWPLAASHKNDTDHHTVYECGTYAAIERYENTSSLNSGVFRMCERRGPRRSGGPPVGSRGIAPVGGLG